MLPLLACTDPGDSPKTSPAAADFTDPDGQELRVGADGSLLLTDAAGAERQLRLRFASVPDADLDATYDPYKLYDDSYGGPPEGLAWVEPVGAVVDGDRIRLDLDGTELELGVDSAGPGLRLSLPASEHVFTAASVGVAEDEEFYGLGEQFESVRQRGHVRAMHFEPDLERESAYNEAHVPVPLLVSSAGWGLLADSWLPGAFDVAAVDSSAVTAVFSAPEGLALDLYAPGRPRDVVARYHARSGVAEIPPTWAFAPLQWRNVVSGSADVRADAAAIRAAGLPTGVIWVDNPWQTLYNSMVPDEAMFPDWDTLVAELHAAGFRVMAWNTPYVEEADPEHPTYVDNDWVITDQLLFSDFGDIVDLTHPDAMEAWKGRAEAARARGIEGWKLDYGEDVQIFLDWEFHDGRTERELHHAYATLFHEAYAGDGDGMILGRGGCLGGHTLTDVIWPGDLDSDFERWDDDCYGEGLCVGGLPSAIRGGTSLAASGYPFFASDTGGYRHERPTKEALLRWAEYSAMLPIMQYGGGGADHNPWNFTAYGSSQYDEETLALFTRSASLHIRLFPYFWMLSEQHLATGLPIVMAQGFAAPEAGVHTDDSFFVGDDLFVAPVEVSGASSRTLTLPPGDWVHWWTGERFAGEAELEVDAPLGQSPVFLRVGAAIPMLRESVVTLSPAEDGTDSWAEDPGRLWARIVPGEGGFSLSTGEAVVVGATGATLSAGTLYSGWELEIHAPGASSVRVDGTELAAGTQGCTDCWWTEGSWVRVSLEAGAVVEVG